MPHSISHLLHCILSEAFTLQSSFYFKYFTQIRWNGPICFINSPGTDQNHLFLVLVCLENSFRDIQRNENPKNIFTTNSFKRNIAHCNHETLLLLFFQTDDFGYLYGFALDTDVEGNKLDTGKPTYFILKYLIPKLRHFARCFG